ncbi:MAG: peptidyl-prolyl cis-trans isomerase [Alphaproteobacteria bacterium]|nr:peptidyl-prolyl cis-trans isomerase [Alphaproteobacteria bacterium]
MLRRLASEPLAQFLALALVIFATYALLNPAESLRADRIIVTEAKLEQLAALYARTWRRPPTAEELRALIDDFVKEEIYYREAQVLGLDKDDSVVRRRLRNKMEFLSQAEAEGMIPTDAELRAYLQAKPDKFEVEPAYAFQQVFLSQETRGDTLTADARELLGTLNRSPDVDPGTLGDRTLLPFELPMTGKAAIGRVFGPDFATRLDTLTPREWSGPVRSSFGLHIVRISEKQPARTPVLDEVRDAVIREWANEKRMEIEDTRYRALLSNYEVRIESSPQQQAPR